MAVSSGCASPRAPRVRRPHGRPRSETDTPRTYRRPAVEPDPRSPRRPSGRRHERHDTVRRRPGRRDDRDDRSARVRPDRDDRPDHGAGRARGPRVARSTGGAGGRSRPGCSRCSCCPRGGARGAEADAAAVEPRLPRPQLRGRHRLLHRRDGQHGPDPRRGEGERARLLRRRADQPGRQGQERRRQLRVRVVAFRDLVADGDAAVEESPFFALPDERARFSEFVGGLRAEGGGDAPESGLEAVALAINSPWTSDRRPAPPGDRASGATSRRTRSIPPSSPRTSRPASRPTSAR